MSTNEDTLQQTIREYGLDPTLLTFVGSVWSQTIAFLMHKGVAVERITAMFEEIAYIIARGVNSPEVMATAERYIDKQAETLLTGKDPV